jgi:hypothetical protein
MNAQNKKIITFAVLGLGVVVGANLAGFPIISFRGMNRKWRYTKYPLIWDIVLRGEAKTFNDYNYYTSAGLKSKINAKDTLPFSSKLLTDMTIGEVMGYQSMSRSGKGQLWATGHFQVIPSTLIGIYGKAKLNLDSMYDERNQQAIADALIDEKTILRKYLNKEIEDNEANLKRASLDVAKIWSSVGIPYATNGRAYNQSYYKSDKASVSSEAVQEALRKQRNS